MWKCYTYRKKKNQNKNSLQFSPAARDEALWDATSLTGSQEPQVPELAWQQVLPARLLRGAANPQLLQKASGAVHVYQGIRAQMDPQQPHDAPTPGWQAQMWGGLSPSIPHHWEVTALSENGDYNLKLMAVNMKSTWKITESEPVSNNCKIKNSAGEKGVERRKVRHTYILA